MLRWLRVRKVSARLLALLLIVLGCTFAHTDAWCAQTLQLSDLASTLTGEGTRLRALPLEIEFELHTRTYLPRERVVAHLPGGMVSVEQQHVTNNVMTSRGLSKVDLNFTYNTEFGLPYEDEFSSVTIVRLEKLLATAECTSSTIRINEGPALPIKTYFAYAYDGTDTKVLHGESHLNAPDKLEFSGKVFANGSLRPAPKLLDLDELYQLPFGEQGVAITETTTGTIIDSKLGRAEYSRECGYRMVAISRRMLDYQENSRFTGMAYVDRLVLPTAVSSLRAKTDGTPIARIEVRNVRYRVLSADEAQRAFDLEFPAGTVTDENHVDMFIKSYQ
jgi:hypothetical protein